MKKTLLSIMAVLLSVSALADGYDQNQPFGFCTRSSRTDASSTYNLTGGGCYTYPIPDDFTGSVVVLKSNGQDMKNTIQTALQLNNVVILDGADGDFIVSSNIEFKSSNRTLLGINNARLCTKWHLTDDIIQALNDAGVPGMSTSGGGGTLPNGTKVSEEAEYNTRRIIIEMTNDTQESYRQSGLISLPENRQNIIIRNITFVGPGSVDVGGNDLISCVGAKHIWVDHCAFQDGLDGNFDITQKADFITVSWSTFSYSSRSYMHQNTNLIGSSDSEATGYLNTTFAFNWWGTGCKQRMPMARVGKIHMLNNYFTSTTASNCINPRKNSEFLIDGNYFGKGVKNYYSANNATAVTWTANNHITEATGLPESFGTTVTVPYDYTPAPYSDVPREVELNAGSTLGWGDGSQAGGTKGSVLWSMATDNNAEVSAAISDHIASTDFKLGSNVFVNGRRAYNSVTFTHIRATEPHVEAPTADDAVSFSLTTKAGSSFQATSIQLTACKVGTNNGYFNATWTDAGGTKDVITKAEPLRNGANYGWYSQYDQDVSALSTATDGTCTLTIYPYNVGFYQEGVATQKDMGFANIMVMGYITDGTSGIATPVTVGTPLSTEYYNAAGQRVGAEARGLVIVRQHMADGSTKTTKVIK